MSDMPETAPNVVPGQILKRAREARNLTVAAIATQLNLDLRTIEALETGDPSKLPAPIFVRGYLRGYARLVGVSESDVLDIYQAQAPQEPTPRSVGRISAPLRPAFRGPVFPWRGLLLVIVLVGLALLGFSYGPQLLRQFTAVAPVTEGVATDTAAATDLSLPTPPVDIVPATPDTASATASVPSIPQVPVPQTAVTETPANPEAAAAASGALELALPPLQPSPTTAAQPSTTTPEPSLPGAGDVGSPPSTSLPAAAPGELRLAFTFNAGSWVEVRSADGSKLLFGLYAKGETREVSGKAPITVLLGNANGVAVRVDGKDFDLAPHSRDNIARFELKAAD